MELKRALGFVRLMVVSMLRAETLSWSQGGVLEGLSSGVAGETGERSGAGEVSRTTALEVWTGLAEDVEFRFCI